MEKYEVFIGREKEINVLNEKYISNKFEFFIIRGRRRVGKTTLIREFCKDKGVHIFCSSRTK